MFAISSGSRFYLYTAATDMRRGFDGLAGLVRQHLKADPLSGDVFIFINRARDRIKLLVWDRTGYWVMYKRLEGGRFHLPAAKEDAVSRALLYEEVVMLLEGIELTSIRRRKRFQKGVGMRR